MNECIDIYFFKPPRLPSNPKHKIDFKDKNDKYNPFSIINNINKSSIYLDKNILSDIENIIYKYFLEKEIQLTNFKISNHLSFAQLKHTLCELNLLLVNNFGQYINSFIDDSADTLENALKSKKYFFCRISMSFADIKIQVIVGKFKNQHYMKWMHPVCINLNSQQKVECKEQI